MRAIERVEVSKIVEYNPKLDDRCYLLARAGMNTDVCSEEDVVGFLEWAEKDEECLKFCCDDSRCSAFLSPLRSGTTPFADIDPVVLLEQGNKYWVLEGKHRVCLAKRAGIRYIDAQVQHIDTCEPIFEPLPRLGEPSKYEFSAVKIGRKIYGNLVELLAEQSWDPVIHKRIMKRMALNNGSILTTGRMEDVPGVQVSVREESHKYWTKYLATIEVKPNHVNTKIWLYTRKNNPKQTRKSVLKTVYRRGLWRKYDEYSITQGGMPWLG